MTCVGIDGGGTKTAAMAFDETGRVLGRRIAGPCNPNVLGFEASARLVAECVDALVGGRGVADCVYIGTAGIFAADDGPRFAAAVAAACGARRVKCENDVMNVIASATDSNRCAAGVCGTGMIVYAKEPERTTRLGGWGYLLGRGGSGYDIGRDAICAALAETEGLGGQTALTPLVEAQAGMSAERIVLEVYRREPAFVASFAPLVFEAEEKGDATAYGILFRNVRAFADVMNRALESYDCGGEAVVSGGIAGRGRFVELLEQELRPGTRLMVPSCPQVVGACLNCARFGGVDSPQLRENLTRFAQG